MSLSGFVQRNAPSAFIAIVVAAVPVWWWNDREPPYIREAGEIVPAPPEMCGFQADGKPADLKLVPGACVSVKWMITPKRNCKPSGAFNVTRAITDQQGRHPLAPINSVYSADHAIEGNITRYFSLPLNSPVGPAKYESSACFACNPGQEHLPSVFWPICVKTPDVDFTVGDSATRGPR